MVSHERFLLVVQVVLLLVTEIAPKSIAVHNATEVARVVVSGGRVAAVNMIFI